MTLEEIKALLDKYKDHKATLMCRYRSYPVNVDKAYKGRVRKETTGIIHLGLNYKDLMASKGVSVANNPLTYGIWVNGYTNCLIEYQNKYQLRMYPCETAKSQTNYYLDGVLTTKQELIANGILKDKPHKDIPCWNVKIENVIDIMC